MKKYNSEWLDYVMVDEKGDLIKPDYITYAFKKLITDNGMRNIRFHDLRHPYVKLKLKNLFSLYCRLNCAEILHFPYNLNSLIRVNIHFIYEPVSQAL